jgi:hypothetical protein
VDGHSAPICTEHARGALGKLFEKIRQMPRLRGFHRKLHQFLGASCAVWKRNRGFWPETATGHGCVLWSAHGREGPNKRLKLKTLPIHPND